MKRLAIVIVATAALGLAACVPVKSQPPGIGQGTYIVGSGIQPGTYRTLSATPGCYWERLSGFGGTLGEIIANQFTNTTTIVTIAPTDAGFSTSGCANFVGLQAIRSDPGAVFGDGHYAVGMDVTPGTWVAQGGGGCYWERQSGFGGTFFDIIANHFGAGGTVVTIDGTDAGFFTDGCGLWAKL